jgi:hypothetical protein
VISLSKIILHARDREYMSGINRDSIRVKATAEVFTPTIDVQRYLDLLPQELFSDPSENFLDYACGDGQFLSEAMIRKLESLGKEEITYEEFKQTLSTIYGVDLMIDNVDLCRDRLLCGQEQFRHIVEQNIQCRNALKFGYNFEPIGPARRNTEAKARAKQQRLKIKQENLAKLEEAKKQKEARQKKLFGEIIPECV